MRTIIYSLKKAAWAPILVFTTHIVMIYVFNMYSYFPNFDIPMHFIGGVAISYFFVYLVIGSIEDNYLGKSNLFVLMLIVLMLTATTTIFWEFLEWLSDYFFKTPMQVSLNDTLLDMLLGILGGTFTTFVQRKKLKKYSKIKKEGIVYEKKSK